MYQEQRLEKILELLNEKKQLSAKEAIEYFDVSRDTIRRDFSILGERDDVQRTHGGLIKIKQTEQYVDSFNERLKKLTPAKEEIAQKALKLFKNNGLYFLDASTITTKLAQTINTNVTIYTHSLDTAAMLSNKDNVDTYLLGGKFFKKNRFYYSESAVKELEKISFDVAFIGVAGFYDSLLTLDDIEDVNIKAAALKNAKTKVLLAEMKKINKTAHYILDELSNFDYLITDIEPTDEQKELIPNNVSIIY